MLSPPHISKVFEYYSVEQYKYGMGVAIDAFYHSILGP